MPYLYIHSFISTGCVSLLQCLDSPYVLFVVFVLSTIEIVNPDGFHHVVCKHNGDHFCKCIAA